MKNKHKCVSVFSGAGLMDLGLRQAGLEATVCYEENADACESARLNGFPVERAWFGRPPEKMAGQHASVPSVTKLPRRMDVVWGGPPCQPFSMAANPSKPGHKGRRETRCATGQCLLDFVAAGAAAEAKIILVENVPQILKSLAIIADAAPGYEFIPARFNALSWLPQSRQRVFLLVVRRRLARRVRDALAASPAPVACGATLRDCIGHLNGRTFSGDTVNPTDAQAAIMKHLKPGGNWTGVPASVIRRNGLPCLRRCPSCKHDFRRNINREPRCPKCGRRRNRRSTHYVRLLWDGPSRVLVTEPTSSSTFQAHPDGERLLSVPEYKALQGVPDGYRLAGSVRSRFKQLGNGVPVPAARWIGRIILDALG